MQASMRRPLFAGAMVALSLFGDSYLYAVLPVYYAEAGISLLAVGWLLSVNRWIRFLSNPVAGLIGRRIGWGWAFAGAMWLGALTTASYGLVKGLLLLTVARALWGVSWSFLRLGGLAAVLADTEAGRRGKAMGLFTGVYRLGSVVGVLCGGLLADHLGFGRTALLFAACTALGALISSLPAAVAGRLGAPAKEQDLPPPGGLAVHWLPVTGAEWNLCLSAFGLQLAVSGVVTGTVGLLVKQRLGSEISLFGWLVGPGAVTGLILGSRFLFDLLVGPMVGRLADRRGRGNLLGVLAGLGAIGLLGLAWGDGLILLILAALLLFVAATGLATLLDSWAGDVAGLAPGRFLPTYTTWQDLGAAVGPTFAFAVVSGLGLSWTYTLVVLVGALAVALFGRVGARQLA